MKPKPSTPIHFLATLILLLLSSTPAAAAAACHQTCGGRKFPFPFGFSSACQIQLNCTSNGTVSVSDFPVLTTTVDTILLNLPPDCNRSVEALRRLYTQNYAPSLFNAVLLHSCINATPIPCFIPTTTVRANFELVDCSRENDSISCYSESNNVSLFLDYENLMTRRCRQLFSVISIESLETSVLDVRVLRLWWWVVGNCSCSENADCVVVSPPVEGKTAAYRCACRKGFVGDGFSGGVGCRRESQRCNISKYISGQCRGVNRILVLAGGAAAAVALIATVTCVFCFFKRRSNLRRRSQSQLSRKLTKTTDITIPVYSYKEMEKATNFFCEKKMLGTGAFGTVYSGKLSNDKWVAIKRIRYRDSGSIEHVINEIKLLSSVSHPNLVQLLGCSIEIENILVYEFMPNGTLCEHLQQEKGDGLAWPVRLNIAVETAQALSYLHNAMHPPIYHRDVKSSNILLDYNYKSKVADFGLSRLGMVEMSHISTAPQGTPGYVDPQYHQHFHLSDKSDVYSFGVVLIEIITALRVVDFSRPPDEINLASLAIDKIGRGCLEEIIDPFILKSERDECNISKVYKVAELAFRCLAFDRDMRPSMMEVAAELEQIALIKSKDSEMIAASTSSDLMKKSVNQTVGIEETTGSICEVSEVSSRNSLDIKTDCAPDVLDQNSCQSDDERSPPSNSCLIR